jgi:hypothetical protein
MMKMAMSPAAAALLRSLLRRAGVERDRILLSEFRSTDWQSLTFIGERHEIRLRIAGPDSRAVAGRLLDGLEDAELEVWGHFVADITVSQGPTDRPDGSIELGIEALTVADS